MDTLYAFLDTIAQLCLWPLCAVPYTFCLWGSELTRRVAVLLFLGGGSGSLGPLLSVGCAASAGAQSLGQYRGFGPAWPIVFPAIQ